MNPDPKLTGKLVDGMSVTGDMSTFRKEIRLKQIDEVFFALDLNLISDVKKIFSFLDTVGVSYHIIVNEDVQTYVESNNKLASFSDSYYGIPMLSCHAVSANHINLYIKNNKDRLKYIFPLLQYLQAHLPKMSQHKDMVLYAECNHYHITDYYHKTRLTLGGILSYL